MSAPLNVAINNYLAQWKQQMEICAAKNATVRKELLDRSDEIKGVIICDHIPKTCDFWVSFGDYGLIISSDFESYENNVYVRCRLVKIDHNKAYPDSGEDFINLAAAGYRENVYPYDINELITEIMRIYNLVISGTLATMHIEHDALCKDKTIKFMNRQTDDL